VDTDIHVSYWLTRELEERVLADALEHLSPDEHARHAGFAFARDRRDFAAAHVLLRRVLSAHEQRSVQDWRFEPGRNGKPRLAQRLDGRPGLSFNLAHTDGLVACVVAHDVDVGIDVERIDRRVESLDLARRYFSSTEVMNLERCPDTERQARFVEIWTLKEAYVKATGDGLGADLSDFAFTCDDSTSLKFETADGTQASAFKFALLEVGNDYRLAVAVRDDGPDSRVLRVTDHGGHDSQRTDTAVVLRTSLGLIDLPS
jgi:4'-phosphopantetheinyl transferase